MAEEKKTDKKKRSSTRSSRTGASKPEPKPRVRVPAGRAASTKVGKVTPKAEPKVPAVRSPNATAVAPTSPRPSSSPSTSSGSRSSTGTSSSSTPRTDVGRARTPGSSYNSSGMRTVPAGRGLPAPSTRSGLKLDRYMSPRPLAARLTGAAGFALEPKPVGVGSDRVPDTIADTGKRVVSPQPPVRRDTDTPARRGAADEAPSRRPSPPKARPDNTKKTETKPTKRPRSEADEFDSIDLNKMTKAGYKASQLNKMSKAEILKIYKGLKK